MPDTECPNCERRLIYAADLKSITCFYCFASFDVADASELGEDRRRDEDANERVRPNDDGTKKTLLAVGIGTLKTWIDRRRKANERVKPNDNKKTWLAIGIGFCGLVIVVSALMLALSWNTRSIRLRTNEGVARIGNYPQASKLSHTETNDDVWLGSMVLSAAAAQIFWVVRRTL